MQETNDSDSAKKEDQVVMYESENPLCGKESPDLNPLYPEDAMEHNSSYASYERSPETGSPKNSEEPNSPAKSNENVEVAQTNAENLDSESIAQDNAPVVSSSADECSITPDANTEEGSTPEVETQTPIMSISAQVMERDNSEGYVSSFEVEKAERRNTPETDVVSESDVQKDKEETDSTAVQCNGCVLENGVDETCDDEKSRPIDENCYSDIEKRLDDNIVDDKIEKFTGEIPTAQEDNQKCEVPVHNDEEQSTQSHTEISDCCAENSENANSETVECECENSPVVETKNYCGK